MVNPPKYLLDTDILIALLRDGKDINGLRQKALNAGLENCFVSAITLSEIHSGAYRMSSERGMHEASFIQTVFNILPFGAGGQSAAEHFGKTKCLLSASGSTIGDMDILIGASAVSENMIMVTHNTKHFSRIPNLIIEDWLK